MIYRLDVTSGDLLRLTPDDSPTCAGPVWSPGGTQLACTTGSGAPGGGTIFLVQADGSGMTALTKGSQLAWSADGTRLIYILNQGSTADSYNPDVAAVDIRDGASSILVELEGYESYPR